MGVYALSLHPLEIAIQLLLCLIDCLVAVVEALSLSKGAISRAYQQIQQCRAYTQALRHMLVVRTRLKGICALVHILRQHQPTPILITCKGKHRRDGKQAQNRQLRNLQDQRAGRSSRSSLQLRPRVVFKLFSGLNRQLPTMKQFCSSTRQ